MKTKKTFEIEIQRSNVTPAQFLAYVRSRVDAKGGEMLRSDLSLDYFKRGDDLNFDIHHEEPEFDGLHEKSVSKPYEMQTFLRYSNGAVYNEICEFEFDSDKTGHGYYYLVNVEAVEEEPTAEETVAAIEKAVSEVKTHSAWERGVKAYAEELVEELREAVEGGYVDESDLSNRRLFERALLNGAADWRQYSEDMQRHGCDVAQRDMQPLVWYINTGRASTQFLHCLMNARPVLVARDLHKGGSYEEVIDRVCRRIKYQRDKL